MSVALVIPVREVVLVSATISLVTTNPIGAFLILSQKLISVELLEGAAASGVSDVACEKAFETEKSIKKTIINFIFFSLEMSSPNIY